VKPGQPFGTRPGGVAVYSVMEKNRKLRRGKERRVADEEFQGFRSHEANAERRRR